MIPAACWNCLAWMRPFWPVVASSTSRVSRAQPGSSRSTTREILFSSFIRFCLLCSRPAVSTSTTSLRRARAAEVASKTTAAGSAPSCCLTMSTPARSAQMVSCSAAAARKVSAAQKRTFFPWCRSWAPILPMVVVLPTPFTPMNSTTEGEVDRSSAPSPTFMASAMTRHMQARASSRVLMPSARTRRRSSATSSRVTSIPVSARMRDSSSSS